MFGITHTYYLRPKKVWNQTNTLTQSCLIRPWPEQTLTWLDYQLHLCVSHYFLNNDVGISRLHWNPWSNHKILNRSIFPVISQWNDCACVICIHFVHQCHIKCMCVCFAVVLHGLHAIFFNQHCELWLKATQVLSSPLPPQDSEGEKLVETLHNPFQA